MKLYLIFAVLLYLLIGQLFTISYQVAYPATREKAPIGLMAVAWPFYILFDLAGMIFSAFGQVSMRAFARFEKVWK